MISEEVFADEVQKVSKYYEDFPNAEGHGFGSHEEFVQFCLHQHRDQIEAWGGLRFFGPPARLELIPIDELGDIFSIFGGDSWYYSTERLLSLYQTRLFDPDRTPSDMNGRVRYFRDGYQSYWVTIRKGQSVARAVLKEVRSTNPKMLDAWTKLFERLGQAWAASDMVSATLSVSPSDVLQLGHLACEQWSSCYKAGGKTYKAKLNILAMSPAVVAFFHRGNNATKSWEERGPLREVTARAWGFALPEGTLFQNRYGSDWPILIPALKAATSALCGEEIVSTSPPTYDMFSYEDFDRSGSAYDSYIFSPAGQPDRVSGQLQGLRRNFKYAEAVLQFSEARKNVLQAA